MKKYISYIVSVVISLLLFSVQPGKCGVVDSVNIFDVTGCSNWDTFKNKMIRVRTDSTINVSLLFVGDSHLQGGYSTNAIRELLRNDSFNAGRGCLFPYGIARTNGPEDYLIKSDAHWTYSRWGQVLSIPLAGYVISTSDTVFSMTLYNKNKYPLYPFTSLTLYHSSDSISLSSDIPVDSVVNVRKSDCLVESSVYFSQRTDSCTLNISVHSTSQEFSLFLMRQRDTPENVTVNVLGMNGISFKHYNNKVNPALLPLINPDLVVIALGTNDIFSRYADTTDLRGNITGLITKFRELLPDAALLLTTPNDHLVNKRYKNKAIPLVCNIIKDVARKEHCGIWDFYSVMGGDSSVKVWRKRGLVQADYVHLTKRGYSYQGELFYSALKNAMSDSLSDGQLQKTPQSSPESVQTGSEKPANDSGYLDPESTE